MHLAKIDLAVEPLAAAVATDALLTAERDRKAGVKSGPQDGFSRLDLELMTAWLKRNGEAHRTGVSLRSVA
jgi:hypothetical protein